MKNEERAYLEAHYQNEIESIKGEVARLTDLLEQVLSSKNGKGIFAQPPVKTPSIHVPGTSQNLGQIQQQNNILCQSPLSRQVKLPSPWI
jgi:hypothetical protein